MPFTENQGAKLYWDEQGSGEPLLLIMGLSYASNMWHRSRPGLAKRGARFDIIAVPMGRKIGIPRHFKDVWRAED